MRARRHYATTGCRAFLGLEVRFAGEAERPLRDPALGESPAERVRCAGMGDIVRTDEEEVELVARISAASPIDRVELRNGSETVAVLRPHAEQPRGRRLRIVWEGAEYRGRGRETVWDGHLELDGNRFLEASPVNRFNPEKRFEAVSDRRVEWQSITTGGFSGVELRLAEADAGTLRIETPHVRTRIALAEIGAEDRVFEAGGLGRRLRVYRPPDDNPHRRTVLRERLALHAGRDNPLWLAVTFEDGHRLWSSPVYVLR